MRANTAGESKRGKHSQSTDPPRLTSAANVEAFLARFLAARGQRRAAAEAVMYETEQIEFRHADRKRFAEHLLRNGPRAAAEFEKARELWARRAAT